MRMLNAIAKLTTNIRYGIKPESTTLRGIDILLQISGSLINLQITGNLIQSSINRFIKLLSLHLGHLIYVGDLQVE